MLAVRGQLRVVGPSMPRGSCGLNPLLSRHRCPWCRLTSHKPLVFCYLCGFAVPRMSPIRIQRRVTLWMCIFYLAMCIEGSLVTFLGSVPVFSWPVICLSVVLAIFYCHQKPVKRHLRGYFEDATSVMGRHGGRCPGGGGSMELPAHLPVH